MTIRAIIFIVVIVVSSVLIERAGKQLGVFVWGPNAESRIAYRVTLMVMGGLVAMTIWWKP